MHAFVVMAATGMDQHESMLFGDSVTSGTPRRLIFVAGPDVQQGE